MWCLVSLSVAIFRWYLYVYSWYFWFLFVLSVFNVRLGFTKGFVTLLDKIFQYVESVQKEMQYDKSTEPIQKIFETEISENNNYYDSAILQNGSVQNSSRIQRDIILLPEVENREKCDLENLNEINFAGSSRNLFDMSDIMNFTKAGIEAIVEDQITSKFQSEELQSWNLLTRNNPSLRFYNRKIAALWFIGFLIRYTILFPFRFFHMFTSLSVLVIGTALMGSIPDSKYKNIIYRRVSLMCFHLLNRWHGDHFRFHNTENRPRNGVAVANHTTVFDVLAVSTDNCYSLVGQKHTGFLGWLEKTLSRASPNIWFERSMESDREGLVQKFRDHVSNPKNPPILIFPEGTCINNTAVTLFKKGAFEVGADVYPVAVKYDLRYGDAFWNSSKQSGIDHVFEMMTSWFIVADIWYLPPMRKKPEESAVQFSNRVKSAIAEQMNVVNLSWDGQLKRAKPKAEWKELHKKMYCAKLKSRLRYNS